MWIVKKGSICYNGGFFKIGDIIKNELGQIETKTYSAFTELCEWVDNSIVEPVKKEVEIIGKAIENKIEAKAEVKEAEITVPSKPKAVKTGAKTPVKKRGK